jgi:hypothetical protein
LNVQTGGVPAKVMHDASAKPDVCLILIVWCIIVTRRAMNQELSLKYE